MQNRRIRSGLMRLSMMVASAIMLTLSAAPSAAEAAMGSARADAVVIVNSASPSYPDFQHLVQPYLDHFGIPYAVLDIGADPVTAAIGDYALVVVGHRQLDLTHAYLDTTEEGFISAAVNSGTGLVNFDNALSGDGVSPRYQFINDVFGFGYGGAVSGSGVTFPNGRMHYIADRHAPGEAIATGQMSLAGVNLPSDASAVASTGTQPLIAVTSCGAGRAVQWGSYDWVSTSVHGPVYGLDDLVWRSLVWAARKPFVMQGMPPFLTMRVDDETGNFEWIHIANEFGIKPWAGLFIDSIDDAEAADISALTNAGLATAAVHAFSGTYAYAAESADPLPPPGDAIATVTPPTFAPGYAGRFFYFDHDKGVNFSDAVITANFAAGTAWHAARNIPIADYVLPHYYEYGSNAFQGLSDWGVEFVGVQQPPGQPYRTAWILNGPFRRYEAGNSGSGLPGYYADFLTVPGHPEFDGKFFNCVTEIRDDAGYEWYPDLADVNGTIGRGTRQTKRALDGMELATLFTHGYYVSYRWGPSAPANWRAILQGITDNLRPYDPIKVTMDYACRYIRATTTSNITSATFDSASQQVTATLGGLADIPTRFYLFMDSETSVMVDVPAFNGTATVGYTLPNPTSVAVTFGEAHRTSVVDGGLWHWLGRLLASWSK